MLALRVADDISAMEPEPLLMLPLREILFWERGGKFERVTGSLQPPPTLRLTIDTTGISKVERLSDTPVYTGRCTSHFAFIVQSEASISDVTAQLKVCLPSWRISGLIR